MNMHLGFSWGKWLEFFRNAICGRFWFLGEDRQREFDRRNAEIDLCQKKFESDSRAAFDKISCDDPVVAHMIQSVELAIQNLESADPFIRFAATRIVEIYHSKSPQLGPALEAIILSGQYNAIPTACSTFLRYCSDYYEGIVQGRSEMAKRLAALCADLSMSDKVRLYAYHLLCRLCGSHAQQAKSLLITSPAEFDANLVRAEKGAGAVLD